MKFDITLLVLIILLIIVLALAFWRGRWPLVKSGLIQASRTMRSMWLNILLGITFGGMIQVLIPSSLIGEWLGPASGIKGILIGSYVGLFFSGGPYVILPVVAAIYQSGAGPAAIIALLAGGMLGIQGLFSYDMPIMGAKLALSKYAICLFVPPVVGLLGGAVYQLLNLP